MIWLNLQGNSLYPNVKVASLFEFIMDFCEIHVMQLKVLLENI